MLTPGNINTVMPIDRIIFPEGQGETITSLNQMNSFQAAIIITLLTVSN